MRTADHSRAGTLPRQTSSATVTKQKIKIDGMDRLGPRGLTDNEIKEKVSQLQAA